MKSAASLRKRSSIAKKKSSMMSRRSRSRSKSSMRNKRSASRVRSKGMFRMSQGKLRQRTGLAGEDEDNVAVTEFLDLKGESETFDDCAYMFLNVEDDSLLPILTEFMKGVAKEKRRDIVTISADQVNNKIMLGKNYPKPEELAEAQELLRANMNPPSKVRTHYLFRAMHDAVKRNDKILADQRAAKDFDYLTHWRETDGFDPDVYDILSGESGKNKSPSRSRSRRSTMRSGSRSSRLSQRSKSRSKSRTKSKGSKATVKMTRSKSRTSKGRLSKRSKSRASKISKSKLSSRMSKAPLLSAPVFELTENLNLADLPLYEPKARSKLERDFPDRFIEDFPQEGPKLYIALVNFNSRAMIEDFLTMDLNVTHVVNLKPKVFPNLPPGEFTTIKREFWKEMIATKPKDEYKPVAFANFDVPVLHPKVAEKYSEDIYSNLCSMVYDLSDINWQHKNYLNHMIEMNVDEPLSCAEIIVNTTFIDEQFKNIPPENFTVEKYLNALLHQVEMNMLAGGDPEKMQSLISEYCPCAEQGMFDPFEHIIDDKRFIEPNDNYNKILYPNIDPIHYDEAVNYSVLANSIQNLWDHHSKDDDNENRFFRFHELKMPLVIERNELDPELLNTFDDQLHTLVAQKMQHLHSLRASNLSDDSKKALKDIHSALEPLGDEEDFEDRLELIDLIKPSNVPSCPQEYENFSFNDYNSENSRFYKEIMTGEALVQAINNCVNTYDYEYVEYIKPTDTMVFRFWNYGPRNLNHQPSLKSRRYIFHIPNKTCYRDYYEFVRHEIPEFIETQDLMLEEFLAEKAKEKQEKEFKPSVYTPIDELDFILPPSIKQWDIEEEERIRREEEEREIDEMERRSSRSRSSMKGSSALLRKRKSKSRGSFGRTKSRSRGSLRKKSKGSRGSLRRRGSRSRSSRGSLRRRRSRGSRNSLRRKGSKGSRGSLRRRSSKGSRGSLRSSSKGSLRRGSSKSLGRGSSRSLRRRRSSAMRRRSSGKLRSKSRIGSRRSVRSRFRFDRRSSIMKRRRRMTRSLFGNDEDGKETTYKDTIREEDKCFIGYNLGDKIVRLEVDAHTFKSYITKAQVVVDNWIYRDKTLNMNISHYDNILRVVKPYTEERPGSMILSPITNLNLQLDNNTQIYFLRNELNEPLTDTMNVDPKSGDADVMKAAENPLADEPISSKYDWNVHILTPCGQRIITEPIFQDTQKSVRYMAKDGCEFIFYPNGCVASVDKNTGCVKVYTSNGAIYETKLRSNISTQRIIDQMKLPKAEELQADEEEDDKGDVFVNTSRKMRQNWNFLFENEIKFLSYFPEFISENFFVTLPRGVRFSVRNGKIHKKYQKIMEKLWMYYDTHSMYVRREDGMKIFYYPDRTECLYPNGLLITTSLNTHMRIGDMIYETVSILKLDKKIPMYKKKKAKIGKGVINPIIEKILGYASEERFEVISRNYKFERDDGISVIYDNQEENLQLGFDSVKLDLFEDKVRFTGSKILLEGDADTVKFQGEHCAKHKQYSVATINLALDKAEDALHIDDGYNNTFNFTTKELAEFKGPSSNIPYGSSCPVCRGEDVPYEPYERFFVMQRSLDGFELIPEDLANMSDKYYKWSPPDYLRDLTPGPRSMGKTIGERTYWILQKKIDTSKFVTNLYERPIPCMPEEVIIKNVELSVREPIVVQREFFDLLNGIKEMSNDEVIVFARTEEGEDISSEQREIQKHYLNFNRNYKPEPIPNRVLLKEAATVLVEHVKREYEEMWARLHPIAKVDPDKVSEQRKLNKEMAKRANIYRKMLRMQHFPNYFEFAAACYDVECLNLKEIDKQIVEPVRPLRLQERTKSCTCVGICKCNLVSESDVCSTPTPRTPPEEPCVESVLSCPPDTYIPMKYCRDI